MNRQLFFILLIAIATVGNSVTLAFSSRSSRRQTTLTKRSRMSEAGVTTRRVFAFTLAGGAHKMFSKMRVSDSQKQNQPSSSSAAAAASSSTSLNYRTPGDIEDNFLAADALWQTAMYEVRDDVDMLSHLEPAEELDLDLEEEQTSSTAQEDSELVEAAKAFIPVAIEISLVAAACSAQRPFIFQ